MEIFNWGLEKLFVVRRCPLLGGVLKELSATWRFPYRDFI